MKLIIKKPLEERTEADFEGEKDRMTKQCMDSTLFRDSKTVPVLVLPTHKLL